MVNRNGNKPYLGDRFDFSAKFLLNLLEVEAVLVGNKVDGNSQMTKSP
jgi:hypothetical protein